jgi:hypothetical protein
MRASVTAPGLRPAGFRRMRLPAHPRSGSRPAPVVPARRQLYRPGGTSYLALPALAANRLGPSDPQVPLNAAFTVRSDRFRTCRHGTCFQADGDMQVFRRKTCMSPSAGGVSDRRALTTSPCARRQIGPEHVTLPSRQSRIAGDLRRGGRPRHRA